MESFGKENSLRRLEAYGLFCWLIKDLGWVLLMPMVCCPAAICAVFLDCQALAKRWSLETRAERIHNLAVFIWLLGNAFWMTTELLFESSKEVGRRFPWFIGPLVGPVDAYHSVGLHAAQAIFVFGLLLLIGFYIQEACAACGRMFSHASAADARGGVSVSEVESLAQPSLIMGMRPGTYRLIFIGPWILKDLIWTMDRLRPALPCVLVALGLVADYVRRFGGPMYFALLFWVSGNTVWIFAESRLFEDANHLPRVCASVVLFLSACFAVRTIFDLERPAGGLALGEVGLPEAAGKANAADTSPCSYGAMRDAH